MPFIFILILRSENISYPQTRMFFIYRATVRWAATYNSSGRLMCICKSSIAHKHYD